MATQQTKVEAKQGQAPEQPRPKMDPHRVQTKFLLSAKGKAIRLLFTHGASLDCTLLAADQFTALVRLDDGAQMLVYKSGLAGIARIGEAAGEGGENGQPG